jgi:hypothetical protein
MAQPFNYSMQVPSAFEQMVSGLKLGASMQEMQAAAEQRRMQMEQMRAQQQAQQQQQERMNQLIGAMRSGAATKNDLIELAGLSSGQAQQRGIWSMVESMDQNALRSTIGRTLQITRALENNSPVAMQMLDEAIQADPQNTALKRLKQIAEVDPKEAAVHARLSLNAMGPEGKNAFEGYQSTLASPEAFQTLDSNAVEKRFGIQNVPPGLYRLNTQTQKLESVGGGGTTVNIKNEGPIAQDYRRVRDAQGNILYDEPIPGTRAASAAEQAIRASEARASGQARTASTVTESIDSLIGDLKKEEKATGAERISPYTRITGVTGKAFEGFPGGARQTAKGYIETIRANIGFDRLDQMRQESPTGGALGQIAVQELLFLQSTLGSLDLNADPDVLIKNLERVKTAYDNVMRKAAAYPNAAKYGFGTGAETAAGGAAAAPAPAPTPMPAPAPATGGTSLGNNFLLLED